MGYVRNHKCQPHVPWEGRGSLGRWGARESIPPARHGKKRSCHPCSCALTYALRISCAMYVRAWELRTYVRTCVRTYVRRTYVRRGRACSAASASCAMCASRRCVHMCARCASCASARCPRSYVRTYVCTYVRTSQKGDTRLRKGKFPLPFRSRVSLAKGGGFEAPPPSFFFLRSRGSAGAPLSKGGASGATPPLPLC